MLSIGGGDFVREKNASISLITKPKLHRSRENTCKEIETRREKRNQPEQKEDSVCNNCSMMMI